MRVPYPVSLQYTKGIESIFDESVHNVATCISAIVKEINKIIWKSWQHEEKKKYN